MRITKISWTAILLLFAVFTTINASCQRKDKQNETGVHIPPYEKKDDMADEQSRQVKKFQKEWDKKMDKLDKKINKAEQELKNTSAEQKENLKEKLEQMKMKKNELQKEIDNAETRAGQQWDSFKQKVSKQYDSLSSAVEARGKGQS